ncbi:GNAT family N-acetyltransferase [Streptomyces sp. KK5PA1]|uniref:GNAT family N-acetyltransferase n=1 Tax=Actinacidiphila acididurans TaxID=2784346 RepID=A0ABS2TUV4_9ACTN|nr:GNAT family N-acetyltransferase [Actinacidiphila acididurans]
MRLRAAREDEAQALSDLALRSKGHWGYDAAFLAACREELRLRTGEVAARRTAVVEEVARDAESAAEPADVRRVLGFATLDGTAPDGELGMLFVEPAAIGQGVGRLLYQHVLAEAGRLGFTRVVIASDPHAESFYLAMSAERTDAAPSGPNAGRGLPLLTAWPRPVRPPAWVRAWTGGLRTVHLGNVGEFNAQFPGASAALRRGGDHYACLAAFAGPHPKAVVLPRHVDPAWMRVLAAPLGWGDVEVYGGFAGDAGLSEAVLADPVLLERITAAGLPVIPWGHTAQFARIAATVSTQGGQDPAVLRAVRRYESKSAAHALFRALAPEHPCVTVPAQHPVASRRALARLLATRAAAGMTTVVKTEYGVGGSGTLVVPPGDVGSGRDARALVGRMPAGGVLVEDHVDGSGPLSDPTFDAVVGADGRVHPVGVGAMDIEDTSYRGVTVGPAVLPDAATETAVRFGSAVGGALAADGYRGWYDVDFVADRAGRLCPTEINLRLTGPAVAFVIQARLAQIHGGSFWVRTLDRLPLGARLPSAALFEHLGRVARECRSFGATLLPTVPTASFDPYPYVGVALAARTPEALDAAQAAVVAANRALGAMFQDAEAEVAGVASAAEGGLWDVRSTLAAARRRMPPVPRRRP